MIAIAILLTLSSILYGFAFLFHDYFWWSIFLFPIPLFYVHQTYQFSAIWGWWWSFCGILLHMIGIIQATITIAQGPWHQAIIMAPIAIALNGLIAIPLFYIINRQLKKTLLQRIVIFALSMTLYFYLLERAVLCIYDQCEGYMLLSPLILLAKRPFLLRLLPYIGSLGYLFIFFSIIAYITNIFFNSAKNTIKKSDYIFAISSLLLILFLIIDNSKNQPSLLPEWYNQTVVIQQVFHKTLYLDTLAQSSRLLFINAHKEYPQASLFLMPESSFYCDHIDKETIHGSWNINNYLTKEITIVTGAFRWHENKHRNTLFFIKNGKMIDMFDKRHAMLLIERSMHFFDHPIIRNLYFKNYHEIIPSSNQRPIWKLNDSLIVTPYICSELFFNYHPDDNHPKTTILESCNDRWVPLYIKELLIYGAIKQAIQWQRDIIYTSFSNALYITKHGDCIRLQTYPLIKK